MSTLKDNAIQSAAASLLDVPIMSNVVRGTFVEHLVLTALGPPWAMTLPWHSWDLSHSDGWKLEVKQSSAIQAWHTADDSRIGRNQPKFDIRPRNGYWQGQTWVKRPGRIADIYVFAYHADRNFETADQREPAQWKFFLVPESELPVQKSISLSRVIAIRSPVSAEQLRDQCDTLLTTIGEPKAV